jgi:hypothetical protein
MQGWKPCSTQKPYDGATAGILTRNRAVNNQLREELLAMKAKNLRVRDELLSAGVLGDGYHPRMEAAHRQHAARLRAIVEEHGWPGISLVGEDGAEAAWQLLQHAIGEPDLQRGYLPLLLEAAAQGKIPHWQPAYLLDRICFFEGKPQIYGTQSDWDENGVMTVHTLQAPERVNDLRGQVGLPPLAENGPEQKSRVPISPEQARDHRREMDAWARSVGWRK